LTLLLLVRVRPAKRSELILSARGLAPKERDACNGFAILQSVDDSDLLYIVGQWESEEACRSYLNSEAFRALRGAAGVLGTYHEWRVATDAAGLSSADVERVK
jgi:quinol monooxygenase YgiN